MNFLRRFFALWGYVWSHPANQQGRLGAIARPLIVPVAGTRRFRILPDSKFSSLVYYNRLPDWDEMNFLLRALRPGDGFIDIGANVGFYTVLASTRVRAEHLHAIEANPVNIEALVGQIELNGLQAATVHACAVGATRGRLRFRIWDRETGQIATNLSVTAVEVEVWPLDELLRGVQLPADVFVKIDVEGYEIEALRGAEQLLARWAISVWLFELSEFNLSEHHHSAAELIANFHRAGYEFFEWDETAKALRLMQPADCRSQNCIACCRGLEWLSQRLAS